MSGLIGRKIGMTSIFDENGKNIPCTVIEAGPCVVTQVRTKGVDGYEALQLGFDDKNEKHSTKAAVGHFKKAGTVAKKKVVEFQNFATEQKLGDLIDVSIFEEPISVIIFLLDKDLFILRIKFLYSLIGVLKIIKSDFFIA